MAVRGDRGARRWRTIVVLLTAAASVTALGFAQPALAEDATGAPAADATTTAAATDATPAATDPTGSTEPATPDPEPTQPEPPAQDPPPTTTPPADPASESPGTATNEEPAGPVVTMEPEPAAPTTCIAASEGAQGTCDAGAAEPSAGTPPAPAEPAPEATTTAPTVAATPTAQPAASADQVLVVSLAPEQPAAAPAQAATAAELADSAQTTDEAPVASLAAAPAVELAYVASRFAGLVAVESAETGVVAIGPVVTIAPLLGTLRLTYLPIVNGVIATGAVVQGARASPRERDGHRAVAAKAEEQERPAAGVDPRGPLENQGLGSSGGSAGGIAGAASLRFFAIATTPMRFDFPSTFSYAPLPSSVPEGALEARPTSRPG